MSQFLLFIAWAAILGSFFLAARHTKRKQSVQLQTSFDEMPIPSTGAPPLHGRDLRVVKRTEFGQPGEYNAQQRESFWYCVGPDAQYYLAIVQANYRPFQTSVFTWVVRPLSEDRMRNALLGDEAATALAFGTGVEA